MERLGLGRRKDHRAWAAAGVASCAIGLVLGACAGPQSTLLPTLSPRPSASASSDLPSAQPTDPDGGHVATGLAIVGQLDPASPLTEIFLVQPDGELRLITGLGDGASVGGAGPVWSPDGRQIAFGPSVVGSGVFPQVWVVRADGTEQRMIAQLDAEEFSLPSWSPDGRHLVYGDATPPGDRRIWLANLRTNNVERIGTGALPRFLPGGDQIGFVLGVEGLVPGDPAALTQVVHVMDLDTLEPEIFARADNAVWSPDGSLVLIQQDGSLTLANADGTGGQLVADGEQPVWSPGGSRFAYLSGTDSDGRSLISLMDRSGTQLWSDVVGSGLSWSPDGTRLAVQVDFPERVVRVLDAATGEELWVAPGSQPAWRP